MKLFEPRAAKELIGGEGALEGRMGEAESRRVEAHSVVLPVELLGDELEIADPGGGSFGGRLFVASGAAQGGVGGEVEPAQRPLGRLSFAAEVDGTTRVIGVVEDVDGLAGVPIGGFVETAVEVDGAVAADPPGDAHAQPQLELLGGRANQRLVVEEAIERGLSVQAAVGRLMILGFQPGPKDAIELRPGR